MIQTADAGMTVNLRLFHCIDQGEEVDAADGAIGGDRPGTGWTWSSVFLPEKVIELKSRRGYCPPP